MLFNIPGSGEVGLDAGAGFGVLTLLSRAHLIFARNRGGLAERGRFRTGSDIWKFLLSSMYCGSICGRHCDMQVKVYSVLYKDTPFRWD